ncbi:MAG: hypothetical protein V7749_14775 [Cocleimonas sp.]
MSTITTINPATEKEIHTYNIITEIQVTDRMSLANEKTLLTGRWDLFKGRGTSTRWLWNKRIGQRKVDFPALTWL